MPELYLDHNVSHVLASDLRLAGQTVTTARDLGMEGAKHPQHLLLAWERDWLLVTNNREDFRMLHLAWQLWSERWGVSVGHAGILIGDQGLAIPTQATAILQLLRSSFVWANTLVEWRGGPGGAWYQAEAGDRFRQL